MVRETNDAVSLVLSPPPELADAFDYQPGQYCTFRVDVEGTELYRCYSMSSTPGIDDHLTVTIKRVPDGAVSNWINDHVSAGDTIDATIPAGTFTLAQSAADDTEHGIVAFAAGSGITPIISLIKSALTTTRAHIRLVYANRDRDSIIFADALDRLVAASDGRLEVLHHLDAESGYLDQRSATEALRSFCSAGSHDQSAGGGAGASATHGYICGPEPFMDIAEATLVALGVPEPQIHLERFIPNEDTPGTDTPDAATTPDADTTPDATVVTIELDGKSVTTEYREGTTVLQVARQAGLSPPYSCEAGNCATCMAQVLSGSVQMRVNDALDPDEVDDGWILTCQSVPTSATLEVRYGYE